MMAAIAVIRNIPTSVFFYEDLIFKIQRVEKQMAMIQIVFTNR